ncbi:hypothetical protein M885DRAFT_208105 [Pelagophyceae sp. CCMP2097]|nr:hypothetical protein M885DRAFT_208105 [Pelagophyceae sp. CCMP2097]
MIQLKQLHCSLTAYKEGAVREAVRFIEEEAARPARPTQARKPPGRMDLKRASFPPGVAPASTAAASRCHLPPSSSNRRARVGSRRPGFLPGGRDFPKDKNTMIRRT